MSILMRLSERLRGVWRRNRRDECILFLDLSSRDCILALLLHGLLEEIVLSPGVCGVHMNIAKASPASALRRIESDIINIDVQLERRRSPALEERKRALEAVAKRMIHMGDAARIGIVLEICPSAEAHVEAIMARLAGYGCKPRTRRARKFFCGMRGDYYSRKLAVSQLMSAFSYLASIVAAENAKKSIVLGVEPSLGLLVPLPLLSRQGALHTAVVGPTGRGKTTLLAKIATAVAEDKIEVIVVDPKGDLVELIPWARSLTTVPEIRELAQRVHFLGNTRGSLRGLIVVDEAWGVPQRYLEIVLREGRSKGVAVILATQSPLDLNINFWSNVSNVIVFGSSNKKYIEEVARLMSIDVWLLERYMPALDVGEALLKYPWARRPILVRIERQYRH